ncbi:MAG: DNA polymerase I [Coriobacteriales bacterium]
MTQRKIAVIDGNSLMHRAYHAVQTPMNAPDGTPTNAVFGFISMLLKFIELAEPDGIVCAFDAGKPKFRIEALAQYKAQRPPLDEELRVQFPLIESLLESMNIPIVKVPGWEGDDILGTIASRDEARGDKTLLVTGDKDACQLASELTHIVNTKKGITDVVIYDPAGVEEKYGVTPAQIPDYLGLMGDASDNIPGVPGVGAKTATKFLQKYGSMEGLYEHLDDLKGKQLEKVRDNKDLAFLSRKIATIVRDLDFELDLDNVKFPDFKPEDVTAAFGALHFNRHLRSVLALCDSATSGASVEPSVKLSYHVSRDAEHFVDAAVEAGRWIAVAFDEPAEQTLFSQEPNVVFSDGAGLAQVELSAAKPLVDKVLTSGKLAGHDLKHFLRSVYGVGAGKLDCGMIDPTRIFDCGIADYLLDSGTSRTAAELAERELGLLTPSGEGAPSAGQFEAAAMAALIDPLTAKLKADGSYQIFTDIELPLLAVLLDMELFGVKISTEVLKEISDSISGRIDELKAEIIDLAGEDFNIDSPMQLSHILFTVLALDTRKSKKGKKTIKHADGTEEPVYSTNASVLEKLSDDHPLPRKVIEYRELAKLKSTYLDALPRLVSPEDGRIHTTFNQTVAATGRLSSSEPNLQNIPVRTELGRRIREAFIAPPDGVFLSADYSQIELRLLAHLSGDEGLIAAFSSGEDFHAHTAAGVFGVPVEEVTPEMRSRAKAVNFGIVYGQQAFGLGQSLHIPMAEAQEMIDRYYEAYPRVRTYLDETVAKAREDGYATTMFGRKRHIPELTAKNPNLRHFGERTAMNHPMQGSAADIIKIAMIRVAKRLREEGLSARMVLQVHDELDFECPNDEIEALTELVTEVMDNVVELKVPLIADVETGPNWAIAH